jgi:photosystem II stability/assembly factor-like uncharacterized protein
LFTERIFIDMNQLKDSQASIVLAATKHQLSRAVRRAQNEWSVEYPLRDQDIRCLAADSLNPSVLYAGTQGKGVLRSGDSGATWKPAGLDGKIIKSLAVSQIEPGTLYAGTNPAQLFVSRDSGGTWSELESFRYIPGRWYWFSPIEKPYQAYVQGVVLSPTDPQVIVAGVELGAVVRSTDGGKTWSGHRKGAIMDCHSLAYHAQHGRYVYEGGGSGKAGAISRDAGETWMQSKPRSAGFNYGWAVAADPADPETWYVSASTSPFKAHQPGKANAYIFRVKNDNWEKVGTRGGLPQPLDHMPYALRTDPAAPGHLYAGLNNGDVWFSPDHGDSWRQLPFNLGPLHNMLVLS